MPYKTALSLNYDCGDFRQGQKAGASRFGRLPGAPRRSQARGKLRGIGIANAIERAAGPGMEFAEIRFDTSGRATLLMGTKNQGQGHETTFSECEREARTRSGDRAFIDGDTDVVAFGIGTNGSRSTVIGGSALWMAADKVIAKGKRIAAHLLEAADIDIEFAVSSNGGNFSVAGTDRRVSITDVAKASFQSGRLPPGVEGRLTSSAPSRPTTTPTPMAATSVRSRSTPIPALWRSSATSSSTTSARW